MTREEHYQPTALTFEAQGRMEPALSADAATDLFNSLIGDLTRACAEAGAWMIGHVKAVLEAGPGGMLSISSTTEDGRTRNRERLSGDVGEYSFRANVIVYGISEEQVMEVSSRLLSVTLPQASLQVVSDVCDDPDCDDPDCGDPAHRRVIQIS